MLVCNVIKTVESFNFAYKLMNVFYLIGSCNIHDTEKTCEDEMKIVICDFC